MLVFDLFHAYATATADKPALSLTSGLAVATSTVSLQVKTGASDHDEFAESGDENRQEEEEEIISVVEEPL